MLQYYFVLSYRYNLNSMSRSGNQYGRFEQESNRYRVIGTNNNILGSS